MNHLPSHVVETDSLSLFKSRLDTLWDMDNYKGYCPINYLMIVKYPLCYYIISPLL